MNASLPVSKPFQMVEQWFKEEGRSDGAMRQAGKSTHNLQLHRLSLQLNRPDLEVDTDGA